MLHGERRAGGRAARLLQPRLAPAPRTATSSRGPCGASSWAASARARYEALSDHLLALRALLEPEGPASGMLAGRLVGAVRDPGGARELTERVVQAQALERADHRGHGRRARGGRTSRANRRPPARAPARRDLRPPRPEARRARRRRCWNLRRRPRPSGSASQPSGSSYQPSGEQSPAEQQQLSAEQMLGDPGEALEILDLSV